MSRDIKFHNFHSNYHFPINTSNNSCFTSFDIYNLSSQYLDTSQEVKALHPSLMVMSGPQYLDMPVECDQINFLSQDSHPNLVLLIEISSFQGFWGFQEDCFKFHDPIYDLLKHLT